MPPLRRALGAGAEYKGEREWSSSIHVLGSRLREPHALAVMDDVPAMIDLPLRYEPKSTLSS